MLGLVLITGFTAWLGAGAELHAMLSAGWPGFAALVAAQLVTDLLLACAWCLACPGLGLGRLYRARLVREAATTCLPFSQVGGILIAVRATCAAATAHRRAVLWPEAAAANVVDITTEVLGQILFVLLGLLFLLDHHPGSSLAGPVALGMALMGAAMAAFIWVQRSASGVFRRVTGLLGHHIAGQWSGAMRSGIDTLQERLNRLYEQPGRIAAASLVHLLAWLAGAAWVWLAYRLLGAPIRVGEAVAGGILSVSFLVPAALGVQEAAYVALGSLFGLDPHVSFGLSLLRRGRDLAIGIPVLLVWQATELRRLRRHLSRNAGLGQLAPAGPGRHATASPHVTPGPS